MKSHAIIFPALFAAAVMLGLAGCNTEREPGGENKAILKAGQQVSADMVGWVAVPNTAPVMQENKEQKIPYGVLAAHNVIPAALNGWLAMPPVLFQKMSKITVESKPMSAVERFVLNKEGKKIPQESAGWVAVPPTQPQVESAFAKKGLEMATLSTNNIVPKELHGWVAVSPEVLAGLVEKYMQTGPGSELPKEKTLPKEGATFEKESK
jgi:hypothetical protein